MFLGGIVAVYIGINWTFCQSHYLLIACFAGAIVVGATWAFIPGILEGFIQCKMKCVLTYLDEYQSHYILLLFSEWTNECWRSECSTHLCMRNITLNF